MKADTGGGGGGFEVDGAGPSFPVLFEDGEEVGPGVEVDSDLESDETNGGGRERPASPSPELSIVMFLVGVSWVLRE